MKNILVVEDDKRTNEIIHDYLENENFRVFQAYDGEAALKLFSKAKINLIILDIMLPKKDGFYVCQEIRKKSNVIIIIISARSDEYDSLKGFKLGADEYIIKPFSPKILMAKVNALLKRFESYEKTKKIIIDDLVIDKDKFAVKIDEIEINLTSKEYELLLRLVENKGKVLSRNILIDNIWGYDYQGDNRVIDTNIKTLRKKLLKYSRYIHTVIGVGYKFEVDEWEFH